MTEENSEFEEDNRTRSGLTTQLMHYSVALLSVVLALGITLLLGSYLEPTPTPLFFVAVMVSAWSGGLKPGLFATVLSTLAINYFLIEPIYTLNVPDLGTFVRLSVFVISAILINSLNEAQQIAWKRAKANLNSLQESEARFGSLVESNIIGMIAADLNGAILEANDNFLRMVGYTKEELRSGRLNWREMTAPESLEVSERAVQELLTTGACLPFEKEYICRDGSRILVLHGAVMTGKTTVSGFVLSLSERKRIKAIQQEAVQREQRLHAEVQAAKLQLETVLGSIDDQFLVLDGEWRYVYVSDRVVEVVGRSREDLLGQCIWDVFPDTVDTQFYTEVHRAAAEQKIIQFEYFYTSWQRWFENRVYPSAAGVSILVTDITDRKRAEESLQRTNQTLQTLLDACPVAIAFFDPQGIVRVWNRAAERIFGWSAAEAIGQFMPTVPHRPQAFLNSIQTVLSGRSLDGLEAQHQRKDGRMVDLEIWANLTHDADGNPGCLGIAWDITERKQVEAALRTSEERYRLLVATTTAIVWTTNTEGKFICPQPSWEAYTGQAWDEYAGWGWLEMFHPEDRKALQTRWEYALAERSFYEAEGRLWHAPSQQYRHIRACAVPLLNADGSVREWIGMDTDIQEQQAALRERDRVEAALRQSETRFQVLVSNMPGMVYRYAPGGQSKGAFTYVSSGSRELIELEPETILQDADSFLSLIHPDDLPSFQESMAIAIETSSNWQWEGRLITPSGKLKWVQGRSRVERTEDGTAWDGLLFDITDRKQAQQELQQTLQTLQTIVDASPLPIVVIEPDMTVKLWNPAAERLFGWSEAEVLEQPIPIVPDEKQDECHQVREAVTKGEVFSGVETYRCKRDGSNVIVNISAAPLYRDDDSVNAILLILQDITEQQRAEANLRDSEERLRLALTAANQGLYDLNVQTGDAIVSPAYAQMLGYDPENFQESNAKWRDRLHPDDVGVVYQAYQDYIAGNLEIYRVEFRQRTQSGDWKWILSIGKIVSWDSEGRPLRMLGTHTDITDRKQAEEALRQSEERLRLALDAGSMGAWEWNLQTNVQRWDVNQYKLFGIDKSNNQLSAETFFQFIHPDDIHSAQQLAKRVLEQGDSFHTEFRIIKVDGDVRWLSSQGMVIRDSNNQPIRIIGVNFDITERKREEEERERLLVNEQAARKEAETANRIKDEFLAVLSHELRSPLNPILGWSKLLQTQKLDEYRTQRALATIERNAKLQAQLIEDLLDVSRILRGKLALNITPVRLSSTIEAALETVRLAAEAKGIHLQRVFNLENDQVMGDAARLQQIVWNLLSNAVKFTPNGGRVEVKLSLVTAQTTTSHHSLLEEGNQPAITDNQGLITHYAQITVTDTGKGISPNFLPYVFDYFRQEDGTTTRKFGGLGLGLAIVRHITELHGGTVWAESRGEGSGATFTVWLPLPGNRKSGAENRENTDSPLLTHYSPLAGVKVLAVDDDDDIRELIAFVLQQAEAEVRVVASAPEVLQQLKTFSPSILIFDVGMPEMDGYMLMRQVRSLPAEQGGTIPAIALTAYAGELNQQQAMAAGFQLHLAKPVEPDKLVEAIVTLLNQNTANKRQQR
jgi:PAS domain S-box-containing protein